MKTARCRWELALVTLKEEVILAIRKESDVKIIELKS
jgi:hypothetical protein